MIGLKSAAVLAIIVASDCAAQTAPLPASSPTAARQTEADAALLKAIATENAKNSILSDEELIAKFQSHRTTFEQLVQMTKANPKLYRVDVDWTDPSDPRKAGVSYERIREYRTLLQDVGCRRGFQVDLEGIRFISATQGVVAGGVMKGFYYSEREPNGVVPDTAKYRPDDRGDSYEVFRLIEGHWYIFFESD